LPPERIAATEQAGGVLVLFALAWLTGLAGWLATRQRPWLAPILASSAIAGGILWVFRNPVRPPASTRRSVLAPNDGRVQRVDVVREEHFIHGPATRIVLQVTPRDVQVTRAPLAGLVRLRRYESGKDSTQADDTLWLGIKGDTTRLLLRQVASPRWRRLPAHWARRMLCWPDLEDTVQAGQVIGHLTLGGTVEVFIPIAATIRVRAGQAVLGGQTVMATLPDP
jgi:phosphatidylserine decarboxylase